MSLFNYSTRARISTDSEIGEKVKRTYCQMLAIASSLPTRSSISRLVPSNVSVHWARSFSRSFRGSRNGLAAFSAAFSSEMSAAEYQKVSGGR